MVSEQIALRKVRQALERRTDLQRQAAEVLREAMLEARMSGATLRQIGEVAGMSHVAVLKIIRKGVTDGD